MHPSVVRNLSNPPAGMLVITHTICGIVKTEYSIWCIGEGHGYSVGKFRQNTGLN